MNFKFIILGLVLMSCVSFNNTSCIIISNDSKIDFDSAIVKINDYRITLGKISASDSLKNCFSKNEITARHDVVYHFDFYVKDSVILKQTIYSNDFGYVPPLFKIKINRNSEIEEQVVD